MRRAAVVMLVALVGAGGAAWALRPQAPVPPRTMVAEPRPAESVLSLIGRIEPGAVVAVTPPFDGVIQRAKVQFGAMVERGDLLFALDDRQLDNDEREALSTLARAESLVGNALDAKRAKSTAHAAEMALQAINRKIQQAKILVDEGIAARDEWSTLVETHVGAAEQAALAQQELQALLDPKKTLADSLDLEKLRAAVEDIKRLRANATVRAPISGILLRPPVQGESPIGVVDGIRVGRGAIVAMIGDVSTAKVDIEVDEADIDELHVGQPVAVSCGGGSAAGRIGAISAVAEPSASSSLMVFSTSIVLPALPSGCRFGMTATVAIVTYRSSSAILLAPDAIRGDPSAPFVVVAGKSRPITLGRSFPDGVEVRDGIRAGELIELP